jgi:hypothetical protein
MKWKQLYIKHVKKREMALGPPIFWGSGLFKLNCERCLIAFLTSKYPSPNVVDIDTRTDKIRCTWAQEKRYHTLILSIRKYRTRKKLNIGNKILRNFTVSITKWKVRGKSWTFT